MQRSRGSAIEEKEQQERPGRHAPVARGVGQFAVIHPENERTKGHEEHREPPARVHTKRRPNQQDASDEGTQQGGGEKDNGGYRGHWPAC